MDDDRDWIAAGMGVVNLTVELKLVSVPQKCPQSDAIGQQTRSPLEVTNKLPECSGWGSKVVVPSLLHWERTALVHRLPTGKSSHHPKALTGPEARPGKRASALQQSWWAKTARGLIKYAMAKLESLQSQFKGSQIRGFAAILDVKFWISPPMPHTPTEGGIRSRKLVIKQLQQRAIPPVEDAGVGAVGPVPEEVNSLPTPNSADHFEVEQSTSETTEVEERNDSTESLGGDMPDNSIDHSQEEPSNDHPTRVTIAYSLNNTSCDPQHSPPTCSTGNTGNTSCASDAVPCAETSSPTHEACTPRPTRLFSKFTIIAFGYQPEVLREHFRVLTSYFSAELPYDQILASLASTQPLEVAFSQELDNLQMMFANPKAIHRRQVSVTLLIEFSKSVEYHVLQMSAPIMDSPVMGPLPFLNELVQALSDKSMSVFQIEFPSAIFEDKVGAALLLLAKVLTESVVDSGLLTSLECEEQSVVLVGNCACLSSDNHALEALLKIFPNQATGFCVVATPSQKQSVDVVETFLNDIPRRLRSKFASQSCQLVEIFRQLSPAVVAAEEDLGAVTTGPYITPSPFSVPAASIPRVEMEPSNAAGSSEDMQVAQPCEETGCGRTEIVGTLSTLSSLVSQRRELDPPPVASRRDLHFLTEDQLPQARWKHSTSYANDSEKPPCNEPSSEENSYHWDTEPNNDFY